jgi:hypothetical protein
MTKTFPSFHRQPTVKETSMKSTRTHRRIFAASTMLLAAFSGSSSAEVVSIDITAVVEYVDDHKNYLGGSIKPGDAISGTYIYNSETTDSNILPNVGDYEHTAAGYGACLNVAGVKFSSHPSTPRFLLELVDNHSNGDAYLFHSYNNVFDIAAPLDAAHGERSDNMISWQLDDPLQQALSTTSLSNQPPDLTAWASFFGLMIHSRSMAGNFMIRAHVISAIKGNSSCPVDPEAHTGKYIASTLLHRSSSNTDKAEAVLHRVNGGHSISTRNLVSGVSGRVIVLPGPVGERPIALVGVRDTNANGYPDIALLYTNNEGKSAYIRIIDSYTEATIRVITGFDSQSIARSLELIPDLNRNGFEEIATLFETPTSRGLVETVDSKAGAVISRRAY